jgi:HPt (histidine-containing phosphotransfer) domain-containing protein
MFEEFIDSGLMELVPMFLANARSDLEEVLRARSAQDMKALSRVGHSLKGAGAGFGFRGLAEIGRSLEEAAKSSDLLEVDKQVATFECYLATVKVNPV